MTPGLLLASAASAAAYTLTPGPGFLAVLGIGAHQGRRAGAMVMAGHFVGDVVWASLALTAVIGARSFGSLVFDLLGLACGVYLAWLGIRAVRVRQDESGRLSTDPRRPLLRGLAFGLSNPKAYPVAVAMFTALLAGSARTLDWFSFPPLLGAACVGFLLADVVLIALVGAGAVRRFYRRHALWVTRASGVLFLGFGVHA
ncbi:MAG: LysE family translocator, partial [Rhodospirillales bacterium]|nr:LysE family translocator [Rhodospirillales bacterium]